MGWVWPNTANGKRLLSEFLLHKKNEAIFVALLNKWDGNRNCHPRDGNFYCIPRAAIDLWAKLPPFIVHASFLLCNNIQTIALLNGPSGGKKLLPWVAMIAIPQPSGFALGIWYCNSLPPSVAILLPPSGPLSNPILPCRAIIIIIALVTNFSWNRFFLLIHALRPITKS